MAINLKVIQQLCLEGESNSLDYKGEQYPFVGISEPKKAELLKDILAMANAFRSQIAYILIGVEQQQGEIGKVTGILKEQFIDDASLQQFINEKINRPVEFQSYPVPIDDEKIIQVIEIPIQKERPYYSLKQIGSTKKETVYFRVGSSTHEATPDEIAKMGKEEIIQQNQRDIEISLIVPPNPIGKIDFTALDIVFDGGSPSTIIDVGVYVPFEVKLAYLRDVFRTVRLDIGLENISSLSTEQLEVETFVSQCSYECVSERKYFPKHPDDPTPSDLKNISSLEQRRLHPGQFEPAFESRYFEVNHDGDFTIEISVFGKDMQPVQKAFPIHVQVKKHPLRAEQIEKVFGLINSENDYIQLFDSIARMTNNEQS